MAVSSDLRLLICRYRVFLALSLEMVNEGRVGTSESSESHKSLLKEAYRDVLLCFCCLPISHLKILKN